ncbi:bifunctional ADP-dependent (S)-NAD(P)H-hydrate dehydratase/NAD(P)H-hydrate epimerase [Oscillatoriales cyanobacterium USR001]|nr:bifunctional ADP-dependent (S)-NAD(P)H-hydrate dehydratase/NAD(P)H-hydrate epimerase [Oscillatoriales cyanobacterium USR001]
MKNNMDEFVVNAEQMRTIEGRIFAAGMPVAALMEKVAGLITRRIQEKLNQSEIFSNKLPLIGVLVGPGHNGGDALIVARELHFQGCQIIVYCPFVKLKELTGFHAQYVQSLNIPYFDDIAKLKDCDLLIDGLFGFGLDRELSPPISTAIDQINSWQKLVFSIDIPSGLHTDTGEVLGTAICATRTFCLGLWKMAFFQDRALAYIGKAELIDFNIPIADITAILSEQPTLKLIAKKSAIAHLPLPRRPDAHKYTNGHLLIIAGSRRYSGAAILTALGARASGVGMLSIAVPESLKLLVTAQLPEALVIGCPETTDGAISQLPIGLELSAYNAIAAGPGLTLEPQNLIQSILKSDRPLILDADALNILAQIGTIPSLSQRQAPTVITPHPGEFKRLFPDLAQKTCDRPRGIYQNAWLTQEAAKLSRAVVLLKGARVCISWQDAIGKLSTRINPESTPALARGGSGDVLTGLLGGLWAQAISHHYPVQPLVETAVWWHAQAGIMAAIERTELGVDAFTLTQYLIPVLIESC